MSDDPINPSHYKAYKGVEVIQLTEQMNFNRGNAVKYTCRAGLKDPEKEIEDLEKAVWYLNREIERLKSEKPKKSISYKNDPATQSFRSGISKALAEVDPVESDLNPELNDHHRVTVRISIKESSLANATLCISNYRSLYNSTIGPLGKFIAPHPRWFADSQLYVVLIEFMGIFEWALPEIERYTKALPADQNAVISVHPYMEENNE